MQTPGDENTPPAHARPVVPPLGAYPPVETPAPRPVPSPEDAWRQAYTKERTKFRVAVGAAVAALAIAGVGFVWGGVQSAVTTPVNAAAAQGGGMGQGPGGGSGGRQGQLPGGAGGMGQGPGGQAGGPGQIADRLLNSDGSVNSAAVAQLKQDAADGIAPPVATLARILPLEVQRGSLTQAQANEIASALGITLGAAGGGSEASGPGATGA